MTLAAASVPRTPRSARHRAPMKSPPICASGNSALAPSRTKRSPTQSQSDGRCSRGNSSHQPPPAIATATMRASTTSTLAQPALTMACTDMIGAIPHGQPDQHGHADEPDDQRGLPTRRHLSLNKTFRRHASAPAIEPHAAIETQACRYIALKLRPPRPSAPDRSTAGIRAIRATRFAAAGHYRG